MLINISACKTGTNLYKVKDYLNNLAIKSGIGQSEYFEDNFASLLQWQIVDEDDYKNIENDLDYNYLAKTINRLIKEDNHLLSNLQSKGYVDVNVKPTSLVTKEIADEVIEKAVYFINNKKIESVYEYEYSDVIKTEDDDIEIGDIVYLEKEDRYVVVEDIEDEPIYREALFDEIFSKYEIADSFEIDFDDSLVIPYGDELAETNYVNTSFHLLASRNHVFNTDGFRVSYTLQKQGIDIHVSKKYNEMNVYGDLSLNNVKTTFKYTNDDKELKNCYFKIDFNSTETLGCSTGKYNNKYINFKDLDSNDFMSLLKSSFKKESDEVEATLKICQIKTPIPNVPTAYLNMDVLVKIYVSGRMEVACYSSHEIGFEVEDGKFRTINNNTHDIDAIMSASAKSALGVNFNIEAVKYTLMDIELDAGVKAEVKPTLHLYDENGNDNEEQSDLSYAALNEITKNNNNVKLCADVSLRWLLDLYINTSKTKMNKMGFSKKISICTDNDQIFGNLHHIENGQFVKKCTRRSKVSNTSISSNTINSNKIVLDSYAEVICVGQTYHINYESLPLGYTGSDLVYESENVSVASVTGNIVTGQKPGSAKIKVYTKDLKYNAYVNILVSTG